MVGGGIGTGVAWPEQHRGGLTGPGAAVVDEREQGVEPESFLVGRGSVLLVRMGGQQRRVQVDGQRVGLVDPVIGGVGACFVPRDPTSISASRSYGFQRFRCVSSQPRDQA